MMDDDLRTIVAKVFSIPESEVNDNSSPENIESIARAGISTGVDGIFIETHLDPASAKSDGSNMLDLKHLEGFLSRLAGLKDYYEENLAKFE